MAEKIVELNAFRKGPHLSGNARCLACDRRWIAVAPVGTTVLDCPTCGLGKGVFDNLVDAPADRWQCDCGCQHFLVIRAGILCALCGTQQSFPDFL